MSDFSEKAIQEMIEMLRICEERRLSEEGKIECNEAVLEAGEDEYE